MLILQGWDAVCQLPTALNKAEEDRKDADAHLAFALSLPAMLGYHQFCPPIPGILLRYQSPIFVLGCPLTAAGYL